MLDKNITKDEIVLWLKENNQTQLEKLWAEADRVRRQNVGDEVHLRGLIEFSNICRRDCAYCGLRRSNKKIKRYRMDKEEILEAAKKTDEWGYGTVVLQSGEMIDLDSEWLEEVIREIKENTSVAVTLSVGERSTEDYRRWKEAGADRYLLRFETSDQNLFNRIHPPLPDGGPNRIEILRLLKKIGYEAGSGVMVGIPGQTYEILANDILLFRELDLDMIGIGPFIPHDETPLGRGELTSASEEKQVPNTELMTYKAVALTRLVCPEANIPSTTALATINLAEGRELGLQRGANIVMPNMTPVKYRALYEIYPAKACVGESAEECRFCLEGRIKSINRSIGKGHGARTKKNSNTEVS